MSFMRKVGDKTHRRATRKVPSYQHRFRLGYGRRLIDMIERAELSFLADDLDSIEPVEAYSSSTFHVEDITIEYVGRVACCSL